MVLLTHYNAKFTGGNNLGAGFYLENQEAGGF
jgi:hypothetical protein